MNSLVKPGADSQSRRSFAVGDAAQDDMIDYSKDIRKLQGMVP
jgi:hypothetical protein